MKYTEKQKGKRNKRHSGNLALRLASVLFGLVLITTWMTGGLLAKYAAADSDEDSARVAAFVFRVQEELGTFEIPLDEFTPGSEKEYKFTVTNQTKNGLICETDQKYTVTMRMDGSLPLVCTLFKDVPATEGTGSIEAQIHQIDALVYASEETSQEQTWPKEESYSNTFEAGIAGTEAYILKIEWPIKEEENGKRLEPVFAGGVAEVEVQITSVQID